jgi:hypothetical protein
LHSARHPRVATVQPGIMQTVKLTRGETKSDDLSRRIDEVGHEMHGEFRAMRTEINAEFRATRVEMNARFDAMQGQTHAMMRTMLAAMIGGFVTMSAAMVAGFVAVLTQL